jgi:uncharacterized protein (DUF983 family)
MTEFLKVRCKVCGEGFRVRDQMSRSAFDVPTNVASGKGHSCPKCGQMRVYDKLDHFFE